MDAERHRFGKLTVDPHLLNRRMHVLNLSFMRSVLSSVSAINRSITGSRKSRYGLLNRAHSLPSLSIVSRYSLQSPKG